MVVDLETSGLSAEEDEIVEIAVVAVEDDAIGEVWSSVVRPVTEVSLRSVKIHGLDNDTLAHAPRRERIVPVVRAKLEGRVLVEHNRDGFDSHFLGKFLDCMPWSSTLNTLALAKDLLPGLGRYELASVCSHLGIQMSTHHQARADALATAEVFLHLEALRAARKAD